MLFLYQIIIYFFPEVLNENDYRRQTAAQKVLVTSYNPSQIQFLFLKGNVYKGNSFHNVHFCIFNKSNEYIFHMPNISAVRN